MNEDNIRHLLSLLKIPHQKATFTGNEKHGRWMTISCPFAPFTHSKKTDNNPSFGITVKNGDRSAYKCLSCGVKGRLAGLPTRLGGYRKIDYSKERKWAELAEFEATSNKPMPKWDEADPVAIDYKQKESNAPYMRETDYPYAYVSYLHDRGISVWDTWKIGIRYDRSEQRVLFPVYDSDSEFRGFTGRSIQNRDTWPKSYPKVKDYGGLPKRELLLRLKGQRDGKKIISEGLFDFAMAVHHGYENARAILGTAVTDEKIEMLLREGEPVYFFMDNDVAGWTALFGLLDDDENLDTSQAWAFRLYKEIPVWIVPYFKNLDGTDPGSLRNKEDYDAHIKRAWLFTGKAPMTADGRRSMLRPRLK